MSYIGNQITGFLGTGSLTVTTSTVAVEGDSLFSADGNVVIGDASGDTITINAATASIPNNLNIDSNTLFLNASNNRVGIGNASPATALDVTGTITSSSNLLVGKTSITNSGGGHILRGSDSALFSRNASNVLSETIQITRHASDGMLMRLNTGSSGTATMKAGIGVLNGDGMYFTIGTSGTTAMTIDSSRNVGIGQTSPSTTLSVRGGSANGIELDEDSDLSTDSSRLFFTTSGGSNSIRSQSGNLRFSTGATAGSSSGTIRMTLDTSGNLLVGKESSDMTTTGSEVQDGAMRIVASSTSTNLATNSGASLLLANPSSTNGNFSNIGSYNTNQLVDSQINFIHESHSSRTGAISFNTHDGSSLGEAMRINSSGNVLVGKSVTTQNIKGVNVNGSDGRIETTSDGNVAAIFNRITSDGDITLFRKAGVTIGSIGVSGNGVYFGDEGDTGFVMDSNSDALIPFNPSTRAIRDNAIDLGSSSGRYNDLYLGGNVYLGGTGSANALSDYEEGSWTPASPDGTITVNGTPTYIKIGKMVFVQANVTMFTSSSGTQAKIDGLPFAVDGNGTNSQYNLSPGEHTYGGYITMPVIPTTNRIIFRPNGGTSTSYNTVSGKNFRFSGWYETT